MDSKDGLDEKIFEVLDKLELTEEEHKAAAAFLMEGADKEVLGCFAFRDISKIPADPAVRLFRGLIKQGRKDMAGRLFLVLSAKGYATCYRMFPMEILDPYTGESGVEIDAAMKIAVYSAILGADAYSICTYQEAIAGMDPETVKRAIGYEKNTSPNGRFILYSAYFQLKYNCGEAKEAVIGQEDLPLLAQYEDIAIGSFDRLFPSSHPAIQEIKDAVMDGQVTDRILQLAKLKRSVSLQVLELLAGMSYLNYPLSKKLKDVVKVCLAADMEETLDAIGHLSYKTPMDICTRGTGYDKEFGLDSVKYIHWAAKRGRMVILEKQLGTNQEAFIKVMEEGEIETVNLMFSLVKEKNPQLYKELLVKQGEYGYNKAVEKILKRLIQNDADADVVKSYLGGKKPVDILYPLAAGPWKDNHYGGGHERRILNDCAGSGNWPGDAFYRRCQVYMLLRGASYFLSFDLTDNKYYHVDVNTQKVVRLFQNFALEGLSISYQVFGVGLLYAHLYLEKDKQNFLAGVTEVFNGYLREKREETVSAFATSDAYGRLFGLRLLCQDMGKNKKEILAYSQDGSKAVKQELLDILYRQRDWEAEVEGLLASKKATEREVAVKVLSQWQESGADYKKLFEQALEKEKNSKIKVLLSNAIDMEGGGAAAAKSFSQMDLVREIHKGGKKRNLAWAYETPFSEVHTMDGSVAGEEYLQAVLLCYVDMGNYGISKNAAFLAKALRPEEFAVYVNELFDKWLEAGAEAKKRWVLYAAAIHGGSDIIKRLQHQIQEWPKNLRGAIACEAVQALSLNPLPQALLAVDGIARKFKFRQVRAAAAKALEFAAAQLGISRGELEDRIVPDLGFDENMERNFDYGGRKFKVAINPALEIEVFDQSGRKLKKFPAPGKQDDEEKAMAAYEAFKQMKKQMKTTVSSQKIRLELALSTGREWGIGAWKQLFVKNPIMHQFAIGLIWGTYKNGELVQSFRYMEDGSFNTEDEEEYTLPEGGKIGLVHPVELSEGTMEAWKQQLADYEITQPFEQLGRAVYVVDKGETMETQLSRFKGCTVNGLSLGSRLMGLGWYRGPVLDGGCFDTYYREDAEIGLGAELYFSGNIIGGGNEDVTIYTVSFYKPGMLEGGYVHGQANSDKVYSLQDVPARYFSEVVSQLVKAVSTR